MCVCGYFFFFNFLYMNFNYCGNLTRWLVFERCSLMHLGWQEDGQFYCVWSCHSVINLSREKGLIAAININIPQTLLQVTEKVHKFQKSLLWRPLMPVGCWWVESESLPWPCRTASMRGRSPPPLPSGTRAPWGMEICHKKINHCQRNLMKEKRQKLPKVQILKN